MREPPIFFATAGGVTRLRVAFGLLLHIVVQPASKSAAHRALLPSAASHKQRALKHPQRATPSTRAGRSQKKLAKDSETMGRGRGQGPRTGQAHGDVRRGPALRNEQQAAYQQKRAARRGEDGEDASESDEEDLPEFDAEAAEAMRAARENTGEKTQKKKSTTEGLIKTANPNAPQKQHLKMSQLDGSAPKPELTRREREELDDRKEEPRPTPRSMLPVRRTRRRRISSDCEPRKLGGRPPRPPEQKRRKRKQRQKALSQGPDGDDAGRADARQGRHGARQELGKGSFFEVADEPPRSSTSARSRR